jgi:hypothetical protein
VRNRAHPSPAIPPPAAGTSAAVFEERKETEMTRFTVSLHSTLFATSAVLLSCFVVLSFASLI